MQMLHIAANKWNEEKIEAIRKDIFQFAACSYEN